MLQILMVLHETFVTVLVVQFSVGTGSNGVTTVHIFKCLAKICWTNGPHFPLGVSECVWSVFNVPICQPNNLKLLLENFALA